MHIFPFGIEKSHFHVFSLYVCTRWQGPLITRLLFLTYLIEPIVHTGLALLYSKGFDSCGAPYPSFLCCHLFIVGNPGGACRLNPWFTTIWWFLSICKWQSFFQPFFFLFVDCLSVVVICLAICLVINNIIVNKMLLCKDNILWLVCWQHYIQWTMLNADLLLASAPAIILSGSINDLVVDKIYQRSFCIG